MKKFFCLILFLWGCKAFSLDLNQLFLRINEIEEKKLEILKDSKIKGAEKKDLNALYEDLEDEDYYFNSDNTNLVFEVEPYNIDMQCWPSVVRGSFFNGEISIEHYEDLLYSIVLEKRFMEYSKMTEQQRNNYEFYVSEMEERFQQGQKNIFVRAKFNVIHWEEASQYRIQLRAIEYVKKVKEDRVLLSVPVKGKYYFYNASPVLEYRNPAEIEQDEMRIERIMRLEQTDSFEPTVRESEKEYFSRIIGRRGIMLYGQLWIPSYDTRDFDQKKLSFDYCDVELSIPFSKNLYGCLCFGSDVNHNLNKRDYLFGGTMGANLNLGSYLRPFVALKFQAATYGYYNNGIETGLDIKIGHTVFVNKFSFMWSHQINSIQNLLFVDPESTPLGIYSLGVGLIW